MKDNLHIVDYVITNLDRLTLRGVGNMGIVIDCINALGELKKRLAEPEVKQDVPTDTE